MNFRPILLSSAALGFAFLAMGCATVKSDAPVSAGACEMGDAAMVKDTIYFGRNKPGGGQVSDSEWQEFLNSVLTPRFPNGLTIVDAHGQWRGESGAIEQERSEVVTVLHEGDEGARLKVNEVTSAYKERFHQEAVLRERVTACTQF